MGMTVVSDYSNFEEGKLYADSLLGCIWKLAERTEKGAVLKNLPQNGMKGAKLTVGPETTRLSFYPV